MLAMRASLFLPLLPRVRLKHRTGSTAETSAITCERTVSYKMKRNDEQVEKLKYLGLRKSQCDGGTTYFEEGDRG